MSLLGNAIEEFARILKAERVDTPRNRASSLCAAWSTAFVYAESIINGDQETMAKLIRWVGECDGCGFYHDAFMNVTVDVHDLLTALGHYDDRAPGVHTCQSCSPNLRCLHGGGE
jgi:hypothetical protein